MPAGCLTAKNHAYALDAHEVYSSEGRLKYYETLKDICATCHLELKPISEHITGEAGTYIHASKQWEYPFAVRNIESMNKTPLRIADVGGGRGALSGYLARQGHHVAVYDVNYLWDHGGDRDIENAFFRFAEKTGFSADYGSVFNIPVPDETFDVVACISVLEHVPYKEYALKELLRVLKRNGKLILTYDFVLENPVDRDALRVEIFTPETLAHELSSLSIQEIPHSMEEIRKGLNDIKADNVNIADDMTVAGLVIIKR